MKLPVLCLARLALVVVLLCSLPTSSSAGRHHVRGRYFGADQLEYTKRTQLLSALAPTTPQQVLTSLSGVAKQVTVTWVTMADTNCSQVQWGTFPSTPLSSSSNGSSFHFVDTEPSHTLRVVHTARMSDVQPGSTIVYRVGDPTLEQGWSEQMAFSMPTDGLEVVNMVVYGDLGLVNSQSVQMIAQEVQAGQAHLVLHDGDMAYDLNSKEGTVGDAFANLIQPIASRVPYIGVQGNHGQRLLACILPPSSWTTAASHHVLPCPCCCCV